MSMPFDIDDLFPDEEDATKGMTMEVRCGPCGRAAEYHVGRISLDPTIVDPDDLTSLNDAFGFTGFVNCKFCGAAGPWNLTRPAYVLLEMLMQEALDNPEDARLVQAKKILFDGTVIRWGLEAETHLKSLLEQSPRNSFLWVRLGNTYKVGEAYDKAKEAFHEVLKLEPNHIEAMYGLGECLYKEGYYPEAGRWLHQALLKAKHAPVEMPGWEVRLLVGNTLVMLGMLHFKTDGEVPMMPDDRRVDPNVFQLEKIFRGEAPIESLRETLIDLWVGDRAPQEPGAKTNTTTRQSPQSRRSSRRHPRRDG